MMRFRESYENKEQFCDMHYDTLTKDPIAAVRTIYEHYGMTVSDEVRRGLLHAHGGRAGLGLFLIENPRSSIDLCACMLVQHLRRMKAYVAANPQGKHGRAEYRLADYGLDSVWVRQRYAKYYETYLQQRAD